MLILIFLRIAFAIMAALLLGALLLHLLPRLGTRARALSGKLAHAPGLDIVVTYLTILPLAAGPIAGALYLGNGFFAALAGLIAAILGQVLALLIWTTVHEIFHPAATRGPRIVHVLNKHAGRTRNHAALWVTTLAVPLFWIVRVAQYVIYPPLVYLVKFPRYNDADWVNVSRHKFQGLVGHDLIWCLYCDWMTGIWSLGSEMLRNLESFWCPIRFDSTKKCENCRIDFPDLDSSWIPADADMKQVADLLDDKLTGGNHSWHSHPTRLTIERRTPPPSTPDDNA